MNYKNTESLIRGWNPDPIGWLPFFLILIKEMNSRLENSFSRTWISEKTHQHILERAGSKAVYLKVISIVNTALTSINDDCLLPASEEFRLKIQVNPSFQLFIFKEENEKTIIVEFKIDKKSEIRTYQIIFNYIGGVFGEIIETSRFSQWKSNNGYHSTGMGAELFPEVSFKIISDLLRENTKPNKMRFISLESNLNKRKCPSVGTM